MKFVEIEKNINKLQKKIDCEIYGKSFLNQNLYAFHIGNKNGKQILLEAGIHAREFISTLFLIKEIEYLHQKRLGFGIYVLPLLNPDGVRLCLDGPSFIRDKYIKSCLINLNGSEDFRLWKANARGVDLNVNFGAKWGEGERNVKYFASQNFIGPYPNSEIENKSLLNFITNKNIIGSLSFHSKGEVVYYGFDSSGEKLIKEQKIVEELCGTNGYNPVKLFKSTGGFSDYMSMRNDVPAFTIELGNDKLTHPLGKNHLKRIFQKNKEIPITFAKVLFLLK